MKINCKPRAPRWSLQVSLPGLPLSESYSTLSFAQVLFIHPWKLTWNPKIGGLCRCFSLSVWVIFRFQPLVFGDVNVFTQVCQASYLIIRHVSIIMFPASLVMFHHDLVIILRHVSSSIIIHQKIKPVKQVAVKFNHQLSPNRCLTNLCSYQKKIFPFPSHPRTSLRHTNPALAT